MKVGDSSYQSKWHDGDGHPRDNWAEMHFCRISWRPLISYWQSQASQVVPHKEFILNYLLHFLHLKMKKKKNEGGPWGLIEYLEKILNPSRFTVKSPSITTLNQHLNIDGITQNFRSRGIVRSQILALGCEGISRGGEIWRQPGAAVQMYVWHPSSKDPSLPGKGMDSSREKNGIRAAWFTIP